MRHKTGSPSGARKINSRETGIKRQAPISFQPRDFLVKKKNMVSSEGVSFDRRHRKVIGSKEVNTGTISCSRNAQECVKPCNVRGPALRANTMDAQLENESFGLIISAVLFSLGSRRRDPPRFVVGIPSRGLTSTTFSMSLVEDREGKIEQRCESRHQDVGHLTSKLEEVSCRSTDKGKNSPGIHPYV